MIQLEHATGTDRNGAALGNTAAMREHAFAHGRYHAVFEGYKAEHKAEYLREFTRLQALRAQAAYLIRLRGEDDRESMIACLKELGAFEAFMKTLTEVKSEKFADNVVTTVGGNLALDTYLAGSAYTVVGPYMGLIGAVTFTAAPVIADTMASHAGWTEAGTLNAPTYTGPRKTIAWNAAAAKSKAPSAAPVFTFTATAGTVKGAFLVYGTGAVSTIDSTAGVLYSAGLFTGGDQAVVNTNTVTINYAAGI